MANSTFNTALITEAREQHQQHQHYLSIGYIRRLEKIGKFRIPSVIKDLCHKFGKYEDKFDGRLKSLGSKGIQFINDDKSIIIDSVKLFRHIPARFRRVIEAKSPYVFELQHAIDPQSYLRTTHTKISWNIVLSPSSWNSEITSIGISLANLKRFQRGINNLTTQGNGVIATHHVALRCDRPTEVIIILTMQNAKHDDKYTQRSSVCIQVKIEGNTVHIYESKVEEREYHSKQVKSQYDGDKRWIAWSKPHVLRSRDINSQDDRKTEIHLIKHDYLHSVSNTDRRRRS